MHSLIKLTGNSLLNIDPSSKTINNERLLAEIEEIHGPSDSPEIAIRFYGEKVAQGRPHTPSCAPWRGVEGGGGGRGGGGREEEGGEKVRIGRIFALAYSFAAEGER